MDVEDRETVIVTLGVDGAEKKKKKTLAFEVSVMINVAEVQNHLAIRIQSSISCILSYQ